MAQYTGNFVHEITQEESRRFGVGRFADGGFRAAFVGNFGHVQPCDAGRRIYEVAGVWTMESLGQRDRRLARDAAEPKLAELERLVTQQRDSLLEQRETCELLLSALRDR
jgi:hypothetical protein